MYNTDHALGDADTAIAYVERLRAAGVDNVMCLIQMGTLSQDEMLESIRIFGQQVIPHFRTRSTRSGSELRPVERPGRRAARLSILSIDVIGRSATISSRSGAL